MQRNGKHSVCKSEKESPVSLNKDFNQDPQLTRWMFLSYWDLVQVQISSVTRKFTVGQHQQNVCRYWWLNRCEWLISAGISVFWRRGMKERIFFLFTITVLPPVPSKERKGVADSEISKVEESFAKGHSCGFLFRLFFFYAHSGSIYNLALFSPDSYCALNSSCFFFYF